MILISAGIFAEALSSGGFAVLSIASTALAELPTVKAAAVQAMVRLAPVPVMVIPVPALRQFNT